jgi:phosphoribosyl-ATP pyrophosphohydrolase
LYDNYDIKTVSSKRIEEYTNLALAAVEELELDSEKKQLLFHFAKELMYRKV